MLCYLKGILPSLIDGVNVLYDLNNCMLATLFINDILHLTEVGNKFGRVKLMYQIPRLSFKQH